MASWACQTEGHADFCIIAVAVGELGVSKQLLRWLEHSGSLIGIRLFMKYCYLLWKTKFFFLTVCGCMYKMNCTLKSCTICLLFCRLCQSQQ
jgi:hypothetical protein